jgi:hypothetical protein
MDDLSIPKFLDRREFDANGNLVKKPVPDFVYGVYGVGRTWIMPDPDKPRTKAEKRFFAERPEYPVQVVHGKPAQNIAYYDNWIQFNEENDFNDYPIERVVTVGEMTIVEVKVVKWKFEDGVAKIVRTVNRASDTRDHIWRRAEELWAAAGSPKDTALVLKLRRGWMDLMEKEGIKRTTASSEMGQWWKTKLK